MTLLNTSDKTEKKPALKHGNHTNEVANFLACEIDTMKNAPATLSNTLSKLFVKTMKINTLKIFRYVTEGTFDAYLWQILENKQDLFCK